MVEIAYFQLLIRLVKAPDASVSFLRYLTGILCYSLNRTDMLLGITIESVKGNEVKERRENVEVDKI
jgi:hypothetical protein